MRAEALPPIILAGLCGVLALGLGIELTLPRTATATIAHTATALPPLAPATAFTPPSTTELNARPLFVASRRPVPVEAAPGTDAVQGHEPPPPDPSTLLTLLGIVEGPGAKIAVIRLQGAAAPIRVGEGAKVDRWEVRHIYPDHVTLGAAGSATSPEQSLGFPKPSPHAPGPGPARPIPGNPLMNKH